MLTRRILLVLSICLFSNLHPLLGESPVSKQVSRDFTSVAKTAIPTIVAIRVKAPQVERQSPFQQGPEDSEDPFEMFGNDFFQHFFKGPRQRKMAPQQQEQQFNAQASGFIVSSEGHILTNNHVVKNAGHISVLLNDGREFDAEVIGQDPNTDVAVIKIDGKDLPHLSLGNSDNLEVGQWVVAIGNPLGLQASLTVGVVSAKGRNNLDLARIEDFIQTDAAINRGNSGGPLLNLDGEVVGINTAIASNMGGYMGIGFAIPSNMAHHIMNQLINNGSVTRGYLGVALQSVNHDLAQAFGLDKAEGALIAEVKKDSPAMKAGVMQGDIVLSYNGTKVNNIATLRNAVSMMEPGTSVKLSVLRDGKEVSVPVQIEEFPTAGDLISNVETKLGFDVESLTPEIAQNLGLLEDKGVVVSKVRPGSPAAWTGMKKGALIVEANQQKVGSADEFYGILSKIEKGKPVLLLIKQDGQMRFLSMRVQ